MDHHSSNIDTEYCFLRLIEVFLHKSVNRCRTHMCSTPIHSIALSLILPGYSFFCHKTGKVNRSDWIFQKMPIVQNFVPIWKKLPPFGVSSNFKIFRNFYKWRNFLKVFSKPVLNLRKIYLYQ